MNVNQYLADALGISLSRLQKAEQTAAKAALDQSVTDGRLTQDQADLIIAAQALQQYFADKGFFKSAVDSAVKDGIITQAQADTILSKISQDGFGFNLGHGGMSGPDGRSGRGGGHGPEMGGSAPAVPTLPTTTTSQFGTRSRAREGNEIRSRSTS